MSKIRTGSIGVGRLGFLHTKNLISCPEVELVAICSKTEATVNKVKQELGISKGYTDYREMLDKANLDAVCITSPTSEHPEQILTCLSANLDVFCDKPIATSYEKTLEVVTEIKAKYNNKICMIGFMKRYEESYRYVKEQITAGKLGKPILFRGYGVDAISMMTNNNSIDYAKEGGHGGLFFDFLIHDFDTSRWLLESDWNEKTVHCLGNNYVFDFYEKTNDVDTASCLAQFKNGAMAFYYCGRTAPHGYLIESEIIGTEAIFRIGTSPTKNNVEILDKRGNLREEKQTFLERFDNAYLNEIKEFVHCLKTKKQPEITIDDALAAAKMAKIAKENFENKK